MENMDILERIKVMLPHWIDHNQQHKEEFMKWVEELSKVDSGMAGQLRQAVNALEQAQAALEKTLEMAGGELKDADANGHSHSHHH